MKRIYSTEVEYGSTVIKLSDGSCHFDIPGRVELKNAMLTNVVSSKRLMEQEFQFPQFMKNGSRAYLDLNHIEYAAPECITPEDAVAAELAGGALLADGLVHDGFRLILIKDNVALKKFETAGRDYRDVGSYAALLTSYVYDSEQRLATCGCHENYSFNLDRIARLAQSPLSPKENPAFRLAHADYLAQKLAAFLIARQIFAGAGTFYFGRPSISVRSLFIDMLHSNITTQHKPLINTKNEPHGKVHRLHLILGDGNMAEVASFLKLGTTGLVLRLLEDDKIGPSLELENVSDATALVKEIAFDRACSARLLKMKNGDLLTACELQRKFLDLAASHYPKENDSEAVRCSTEKVFEWWNYVLDKLENGEMKDLVGVLDWPTKFHLGELLLKRYGIAMSDLPKAILRHEKRAEVAARLRMLEQRYHELSENGLSARLKAQGIMTRIIDPAKIIYFKDHSPRETRAYGRSELLRFVESRCPVFLLRKCDWGQITLVKKDADETISEVLEFEMDDPFVSMALPIEHFLVKNGWRKE
ncbi:MAG: proteasome accessory factor PafA2 family protein [Candidatus Niyogibacteria bacterium]|nr:proteasome accessory factor PafA2 family protein [Candidatus Niyogibacteria bacterium]